MLKSALAGLAALHERNIAHNGRFSIFSYPPLVNYSRIPR